MKKIALVTGSTDGIGKETAKGLLTAGFDVILTGRNEEKGLLAKTELTSLFPHTRIFFHKVNFGSQKSINYFVKEIEADFEHIDVLVNNVGLLKSKRIINEDGFEEMFATNYLSAFTLSNLLLHKLIKSPDARIVNVSGGAYKFGKINFDDLNFEQGFSPLKALGQAKLANLLFTYEAGKRWKEHGVKTYAVDPGAAKTPGHKEHSINFLKWALPFIGTSTEKAALSSIKAASDVSLKEISGVFLNKRGRVIKTSSASNDQLLAHKLWETTLKLLHGKVFLN